MIDDSTHNLTSRQLRAISTILSSRTLVEAANRLHVSRETLHAWLRDPSFKAEYEAQSRTLVQSAIDNLKLAGNKATEVLNRLLDSRSPTVRFKAACKVVDSLEKFIELDINERLSELERQIAEDRQGDYS